MNQPPETDSQFALHVPPAVHESVIPLHLLQAGQLAEVEQLVGEVEVVHRLEEMGLRSGTTIEMVQPGAPCIIKLAGHKLCFRNSEACNVLVRPGSYE